MARAVARLRDRRLFAAVALVAVVVAWGGTRVAPAVASLPTVPPLADPATLREWVRGFGPWAPLAFVALQAAQVVVAPVPGHVSGLASGYPFGPLAGTAYSLVGAAPGTYLAVGLTRRLGRPFAVRLVGAAPIDRVDAAARRRGLLALFAVFLVPGLPDGVICLAAGLTDLDVRRVVAVSVVGRAPSYYLVNLAGAGAGAATGDHLLAAALAGGGTALTALVARRRRRVFDWLADVGVVGGAGGGPEAEVEVGADDVGSGSGTVSGSDPDVDGGGGEASRDPASGDA